MCQVGILFTERNEDPSVDPPNLMNNHARAQNYHHRFFGLVSVGARISHPGHSSGLPFTDHSPRLLSRKSGAGFLASVAVCLACSCQEDKPSRSAVTVDSAGVVNSTPLASKNEGETLFTLLDPGQSKVLFFNRVVDGHPLERVYHGGFACGSAAMGDFDGDGTVDLFFTGGAGKNGLFLQTGGRMFFEDATETAGVDGGESWSAGSAVVDIDNDGDLDIYVSNYDSPNHLFVNDGTARFTERAAEAGLDLVDASLQPIFGDYDRDGDLDVFVLTYQLFREGGRPAETPVEVDVDGNHRIKAGFEKYYHIVTNQHGVKRVDDAGRPDYLFRNEGAPENGGLPRFKDISKAAGLTHEGFGLSANFWDFDDDGWLDIFVGQDYQEPDLLYRNMGDGTFQNVAPNVMPHSAWFTMGSDHGDLDGDGREDLFAVDMASTTHYKQKVAMGPMGERQWTIENTEPRQVMQNALFLNTGLGRFREAARLAGLAKTDWSWATKLADFDLDGKVDVFVANGAIRSFNHADKPFSISDLVGNTTWDIWKTTEPQLEKNRVFRNQGGLSFQECSAEWGLDLHGVSHGLACGDLDGDGDPDLVVTNGDGPVSVYQNNAESDGRITLRLEAMGANREAIGAKVELKTGSGLQVATVRTSGGYLTNSSADLNFAIGKNRAVEVTLRWPDGSREDFNDLAADFTHHLKQGNGRKSENQKERGRLFAHPQPLPSLAHRERRFHDFIKQPLLPNKLSQEGPTMVWADIDGDGDQDFFFGQARGKAGVIVRNDGGGKLEPITCEALEADKDAEDVGSAFFDADGDGDLDLYVASGSYEYDRDDPLLADRLYLNEGGGRFVKAPEGTLPGNLDVGSCVAPYDFDGDGDLDLFVGSRVIPGEYPLTPTSRLLVNEGGRFTNAGDDVAPGLSKAGMVTDALWVDVNGDQKSDLVLSLEWGPVKIFTNQKGVLKETTAEAGLADRHGWWLDLAAADVDADGDVDLAVSNFGLNTKYHASAEAPALIYYGDLQGDGKKHIIEAEFEGETLFPIRGKSCSSNAMPQLAKKFETYHEFALAPLSEIYAKPRLEEAERFQAHELRSGLLINDGAGNFTFQPLPHEAQLSPVMGMAFGDFDADGTIDLALAENFYHPQFESGRYDGGVGLLLKGDGAGDFLPVHPEESGIFIPGDARDLVAVDLNGDGHQELVVARNSAQAIVLVNQAANWHGK